MTSVNQPRRKFIKTAALGTAGVTMTAKMGMPSILKHQKPNEQLGVGIIGFGIRARQMANVMGYYHPKAPDQPTGFGTISREDRTRGYGYRSRMPVKPFIHEPIRAICDIYQDATRYASELFDKNVKIYSDYRKLLDDTDIDVVMIFTPDHWHAKMAIDACMAGKDIFVEKCPTHNFSEAVALKKAVEENKRIIQLNESVLHNPIVHKMRDMVQSGDLGTVHLVECTWHIPAKRRIWDWPIPSDLSPETINWDSFQGLAPKTTFDPKRVIQWRCFWDYGTGVCGDLFSHSLAGINFIMDLHIPKTAVASGGTYALKDYFHVPDLYSSINEYPDKETTVLFSANFASSQRRVGITYNGTRAAMTSSGNEIQIIKPGSGPGSGLIEKIPVEDVSDMTAQEKHFHEFFDAIRTRKETTCNMNMTFAEDISCHMGTEAFHQGKKVTWDSSNMKIV